ncbi:outer membrane lipoprotein-sorting protein, partial [bacterium]|nr:outer membrane lipoprotein-sorting protein [bacterium]
MKGNIDKGRKILCLFGMLSLLLSFNAMADEKGRKIMEEVDSLPVLEKMISETVLDIYDAQDKLLFSKKSRTGNYISDFRDNKKRLRRSISYFFAPADDKGNGALMIEVPDGEDDQWIYLKGLRKPKRVMGSDKGSSFMGSDFSNGDVSARDIDDSDFTWLGTENLTTVYESNNKEQKVSLEVEKIQSVFKSAKQRDDYGYSKSIVWINVKSGLPLKMEHYNLGGQLEKSAELKSFTLKRNKDEKKIYIVTSLEIKN